MSNYQILEARDQRVMLIEKMLKEKKVVLSLRVNYPGINKDNDTTRKIFNTIDLEIQNKFGIKDKLRLNNGEGPVCIYLIDSKDLLIIKKQAIEIEENHPLGRLVDLDVYYESLKSISRSDLKIHSRTCMLCSENAFVCIKNKSHKMEDVISYIEGIVANYER